MKNILITTSSFAKNDSTPLENLKAAGLHPILNPHGRKLTENEVMMLIQQHNPIGMIAGVEPLTRNVLQAASELKVISRAGIGMDAVDLEAAEELGIIVRNTPDAPTIPVAELTLGMILSLLRKIHLSDANIRKHEWYRPMGALLHEKTVGIIGCGRIGSHLAKLIAPFQCSIIGFDPFIEAHDSITVRNLDELLTESDIISLHLPYSSENHHFIGASQISKMKKGAFLINASRGGLVDEEALYNSLTSGHLGGAAIDSFEKEPYNGKLTKLDNTLLTGHIGSYAIEGRVMMEMQATDNLLTELQP